MALDLVSRCLRALRGVALRARQAAKAGFSAPPWRAGHLLIFGGKAGLMN